MVETKYKKYHLDTLDIEKALIESLKKVVEEYNISSYSDGVSFVVYGRDGKALISISLGEIFIRE
mgnify:FL=1